MGADLLLMGFTHDTTIKPNLDELKVFINGLPEAYFTEEAIGIIDPSDNLTYAVEDDDDLPDDTEQDDPAWRAALVKAAREYLVLGAQAYVAALTDEWCSATGWFIPGTTLEFIVTGGDSWGDDPFDGWTALGMFLDAHRVFLTLSTLTGALVFDNSAIPTPQQMLDFAVKE